MLQLCITVPSKLPRARSSEFRACLMLPQLPNMQAKPLPPIAVQHTHAMHTVSSHYARLVRSSSVACGLLRAILNAAAQTRSLRNAKQQHTVLLYGTCRHMCTAVGSLEVK
jgi:hypothetical protein